MPPTHDAVAGICPDDQTAVTFEWDEDGAQTGIPGGIYVGRCPHCHKLLVREHGPIVTTIGGGPSHIDSAIDAALARRAGAAPFYSPDNAPDELTAEIGKLSQLEKDELLASIKSHNAEAALDAAPEPEAEAPAQNKPWPAADSVDPSYITEPVADPGPVPATGEVS